ncbi:MAG TPA: sensor histidine kinase [Symbiobacteriaceae bacterium]|nr:sensor histidine kinase [Symbiobacteriaceae bacterium]
MLKVFFTANLTVIHFGYGLIFFLMGFGAALAGRAFRESRLAVASSLPWLSAFGALLGLAQWGVVFIPLQAAYLSPPWLSTLNALHGLVLVAAHACLLVFGIRLLARFESVRWSVPGALAAGALACFLTVPSPLAPGDWQSGAHVLAAYGFGLPGAILSARGLLLQRKDVAACYPRSGRALLVAAWAFILSVPIGPMAVPVAGGEPFTLLGVPVQVPLSIGGLVLAWSLLSGLEALRVENARRVERAERREAMLEERYRLSKDLKDGVIQDLFAAGMLLGAAGLDLKEADRVTLRAVEKQLQEVVDRLRVYVMDLEPSGLDNTDLFVGTRRLVDEFRANTLIPVSAELEPGIALDPDATSALYAVVQEALSNVRRHAQASLVTLELRRRGDGVCLTITDNGSGLAEGSFVQGAGLERMARSAEAVDGALTVGRAPGGGTRVVLELPGNINGNTEEPHR